MTRIAVLVSGGGSNLAALLDAQKAGRFGGGVISLVISSRPGVYALERAAAAGVKSVVISADKISGDELDIALLGCLEENDISLVVLAGFLRVVGSRVLLRYQGRVINIHPSLLPKFGGKGMYGLRVHRAVLESGAKVTGATVHLVSEVVDGGEILLQKQVPVLPGDTPEKLSRRVAGQAEQIILPQAVANLLEGMV